MTRILIMSAVVLLCAAPVRADVTITQTMSVEGGMAKMMGGMTPRMVTRIKGLVSRMEVEVMGRTMATITDLGKGQFIMLDGASRTAQVFGAGGAAPPGAAGPAAMPKIDMSFKATGQSRVIEGAQCDEHTFTMAMNMAEAGASSQMPAEAVAAMKDVRMAMAGSVWIATSGPGVADYVRFQKAADANVMGALMGMKPGQSPAGMEQLMAASAAAPGMPYLTEMTMTFEGSGKLVEMMKGMGPIQMTHRITAVSTDPVPDEMFQIPEGYTIEKQ